MDKITEIVDGDTEQTILHMRRGESRYVRSNSNPSQLQIWYENSHDRTQVIRSVSTLLDFIGEIGGLYAGLLAIAVFIHFLLLPDAADRSLTGYLFASKEDQLLQAQVRKMGLQTQDQLDQITPQQSAAIGSK